ncbi:transposase [Accumulibacter sp.]|uniref:transposase n=1 Tax=Accumulibacter sp. TaxID=2053492 RepID=UPI0034398BBD
MKAAHATSCLLIIVLVAAAGTNERVRISGALRESPTSWLEVLRHLKTRGLDWCPLLAAGGGTNGLWSALDQTCPEARPRRCRIHEAANVLNELQNERQG